MDDDNHRAGYREKGSEGKRKTEPEGYLPRRPASGSLAEMGASRYKAGRGRDHSLPGRVDQEGCGRRGNGNGRGCDLGEMRMRKDVTG